MWNEVFSDVVDVQVSRGDIFQHTAHAIVSPANSFGYMDGGVDLAYSRFFGWELESNLKALIAERFYGELPVGQAVIVPTGHDTIPFMVSLSNPRAV